MGQRGRRLNLALALVLLVVAALPCSRRPRPAIAQLSMCHCCGAESLSEKGEQAGRPLCSFTHS